MQSELEDKLNSTIHSLKMEKDELELKKDQELSSLKRFTEKLQRERDDAALRFEEEKHRSMMLGKLYECMFWLMFKTRTVFTI